MKWTPLALSLALVAANLGTAAAAPVAPAAKAPFSWQNATVYFVLTDRFSNGDKSNDLAYGRQADAAPLRGYMGGDLAGLTRKIRDGYFDSLGVTAIWLTPPVEQIHAGTDEGTGKSYGFHGYWASDFTAVDANLGTEQDMRTFVETAHQHGIRVLLDVVMNHTGPVTEADPAWPAEWVRTEPQCAYKTAETTIRCTLVKNLPDFRTDSDQPVELPPALVAKWKKEGRYAREVKELDAFFASTGYPRAPRYYLMKWHADWVRKYGVDGFRADTVKHVEAGVWKELYSVASAAYEDWKRDHPRQKLGDDQFFMTAEVYNYRISDGLLHDLGDRKVNYFDNGFASMINFGLVDDAKQDYETLFSSYSAKLHGELAGRSVLNYIDSHDFDRPLDPAREQPYDSATKLLLAPGAAQIYYGDESARRLDVAEASGDAKLRSYMNWDDLKKNAPIRAHWARLGLFRRAHIAIGAGVHQQLSAQPYVFKRTYHKDGVSDRVVIALGLPAGQPVAIDVGGVFAEGRKVKDHYTGKTAVIQGGKARFEQPGAVLLIAD